MEKPAPVIPKGSLWGELWESVEEVFYQPVGPDTDLPSQLHAVSDFKLFKKLLHTHYFNTTTVVLRPFFRHRLTRVVPEKGP